LIFFDDHPPVIAARTGGVSRAITESVSSGEELFEHAGEHLRVGHVCLAFDDPALCLGERRCDHVCG
jgi:hypothetical protein